MNAVYPVQLLLSHSLQLNYSKNMRLKTLKANKTPATPLQQESEKLQNKLDSLKKQIKQQRQQQQLQKSNKTQQETPPSKQPLNTITPNKSKSKVQDDQAIFIDILGQQKIENLSVFLREKGIKTLQELLNTENQAIDQWKITVGYRIKLKKIKENHIFVTPPPRNSLESSQKAQKESQIQKIIQKRNNQKVYEPLNRPIEILDHEQLQEQDQDIMIKSLMQFFRPKEEQQESAIKKDIQIQTHSQEKLQKSRAFSSGSARKQQESFCWNCLKEITQKSFQTLGKHFCSQTCLLTYKKAIESAQDQQFFGQVRETQSQFQMMQLNRKYNKKGQVKVSKKIVEQSELQEIDLQIV